MGRSVLPLRSNHPADPRPHWLRASVGLLALAALLAAGCSDSSGGPAPNGRAGGPENEEQDAIAVQAEALRHAQIHSLYSTSATLRADKQATVTARTRGVIRDLLVEEGDRVAEGQPLARLEDDEQKIEYERSATTRDTKRREYERAKDLHDQGLLSEEEYETARREAEESKQSAALNELVLSRTVIRAPFRGKIVLRHLDEGATVSDGTPVYDIADLDPLYADVHVPERQVGRLAVNQRVRLVADSSGDSADARIERIAPLVDPTTGTVKVTLAVASANSLRPGSFVRVEIVTETHDEALVVPRSALVAEGRRWYLFRVQPEGDTVERLEVLRGFEERDRVEVLPTGNGGTEIVAGDRVIVVGASALTDGAKVRIIDGEAGETSGPDEQQEPGDGEARDAA